MELIDSDNDIHKILCDITKCTCGAKFGIPIKSDDAVMTTNIKRKIATHFFNEGHFIAHNFIKEVFMCPSGLTIHNTLREFKKHLANYHNIRSYETFFKIVDAHEMICTVCDRRKYIYIPIGEEYNGNMKSYNHWCSEHDYTFELTCTHTQVRKSNYTIKVCKPIKGLVDDKLFNMGCFPELCYYERAKHLQKRKCGRIPAANSFFI